jgi:hypothetical protein
MQKIVREFLSDKPAVVRSRIVAGIRDGRETAGWPVVEERSIPDIGPSTDPTAAFVLAKDVTREFAKACGISSQLFGAISDL